MVINALDKNALELGVQLRDKFGGRLIAISMAPAEAKPVLTETLAFGADEAYLLTDRKFAGSDTWGTSYILSAGIMKISNFDVILTGEYSLDGSTAQVGPQIAEFLDIPFLSKVCNFTFNSDTFIVDVKSEQGTYKYKVKPPFLLTVTKDVNTPHNITLMGIIKARGKQIVEWSFNDLDIEDRMIGLQGSPTQMADIIVPDIKRKGERIEGNKKEIAQKIVNIFKQKGVL